MTLPLLQYKLKISGTDRLALGQIDLASVAIRQVAEGDVLSAMEFRVSIVGGGGVTFKGGEEVIFYEYNTSSGLITYWFFGGFITHVVTQPRGNTQEWVITASGYDMLLDTLDADSFGDAGLAVICPSDTFANQIISATTQIQTYGGGVPVSVLDTSAVPNWTPGTPMPYAALPSCTLRDMYTLICANYKAAFPLTDPRFSITPPNSTTEGPGQVLIYDAAATPTPTLVYHVESPDLATTFPVVSTKVRTKDYTALQTAQNGLGAALGGPAALRARKSDATAMATYPNPYSARSQWGGPPIVNTQWVTQAAVDAGTQTALDGKKAPRHSWVVGTFQRVRAGQYVKVASDTLEAVTNLTYPVPQVDVEFTRLIPFFGLTLGQRLRRYGDPADANLAAEDQPDVTGPDPPTSFALTDTPGGTYHGATHDVSATFSWTAPTAADLAGYYVRLQWGGHLYQSTLIDRAAVQFTWTGLPPSTAISNGTIFAVDYHNNRSIDSSPAIGFTTAAVDNPNPPTSLAYTTVYYGGGISQATVTWVAGAQPPTRASYTAELTAPSGRTYVYEIKGTATAYTFKNLSPGLVYSLSMVAVTPYGDASQTPATLSITAASGVVSSTDAPWHVGDKDSDTSDSLGLLGYKLGTPVGTHVTAVVSTTVVYDGIASFKFVVGTGGSGDSIAIVPTFTRACAPSQVLTLRFKEGNATNVTGTLAVIVTYYSKSGGTVGSPATVYSAAPSTTSGGVLHEVQVTIPSTSTITNYGVTTQYTTAGTANGIYVGTVSALPTAGRVDVQDAAIGPAQTQLGTDVLLNGSMEIPSLTGTLPAGWTSTGTVAYSNALGIGAGDGQYACQLGLATGTHTLTSPLVQWTAGRGYSGRVRWREYLSVIGASLVVTVTANWYTAAQALISTTTLSTEVARASGSWLSQSAAFDGISVPATTAFVAIQFQAVTTSGTPYYGVDALELLPLSRPWPIYEIEHRLGSGALVGLTEFRSVGSGGEQRVDLNDTAAWWRLLSGAGIDLTAAASGGQLKTGSVVVNAVKQTAGSSLPGSPSTGDVHWYTTYRTWVAYDGTRWLGPELVIAEHNYLGAPPYSATTEILATSLRSDRALYLTRYSMSYYTGGGVDPSNYWKIYLRRLTSGISVDNIVFGQTTSNNWHKLADKVSADMSNNPLNASDIWLQTYIEKTGAPNSIYVQVAVYGCFIYT